MAINWRELLPHYVAMLLLYGLFIVGLQLLFNIDSFGSSLAVALAVAFGYPVLARRMGFAPASWQR